MVAMKSGKENSEVHVGSNANASSGSHATVCNNKENTTTTLLSPSPSTTSSSTPHSSTLPPSSTPQPITNNSATTPDAIVSANSSASQLGSSPTSPVLSLPAKSKDESTSASAKPSKQPTKCPLEKCLLCTREQPHCLSRSPTWPAIMRVVFFTLKFNYPDKEFFNLKEDVYSVMLFHWSKLSINKKSSSNWKKHIQDMLSHSKELFESGLEIYGQNGYWRLKVTTDPWTLSGKTRRSPKKGLALKRPLEGDSTSNEQMLRRPFIPYIAKEAAKHTTPAQTPVSYVFVNEQSVARSVVPTATTTVVKEPETPVPYNVPNPLTASQARYTFVAQPNSPPMAGIFPNQFPLQSSTSSDSPSLPATHPPSPIPVTVPAQYRSHPFGFRPFARTTVSLPGSRRQSPQRSRSPSPQPQSMPTSPRSTTPVSMAPFSAPTSPRSPSRVSSRASSRRSSRSSPYSLPMSPRSQPLSPRGSPPPSPRALRILRALRSPPSPQSPQTPLTPQTPLSPRSPPQSDEALDNLRNTFEQFNWHARSQDTDMEGVKSEPPTPELHHIAFNLFANAKPANPCDVSFLLNE